MDNEPCRTCRERVGMDNRAEELRELASEVGQIAYGVHEYFGNGLMKLHLSIDLSRQALRLNAKSH